jgi:hypothetical protein
MQDYFPFPKIPSLRNLIGSASREEGFAERGPVTFVGQPKLHGTNAGIALFEDDTLHPQSRNRRLSLESDNYNFASFVSQNEEALLADIVALAGNPSPSSPVVVYGEWTGPGIQTGVAISQLPEKVFFPFAVRDVFGLRPAPAFAGQVLKTIASFEASQSVTFDLATEEGLPEALETIQAATDAYGAKCPVAAALGVEGLGEGLVWWSTEGRRLIFKSKDEAHQQCRKPLPTPKDAGEQARASMFADMVVTPARMEGAYEWLKEMNHPMDRSSTGRVIVYVLDDVRAECIEEFKQAGAPWKACASFMSAKARNYFFERIDS